MLILCPSECSLDETDWKISTHVWLIAWSVLKYTRWLKALVGQNNGFQGHESACSKEQTFKGKTKKKVSGYLNWFPRYAPTKTHGVEIAVFGAIFPILGCHGNQFKTKWIRKVGNHEKPHFVITSQNKIVCVLTIPNGLDVGPNTGEIKEAEMHDFVIWHVWGLQILNLWRAQLLSLWILYPHTTNYQATFWGD